jgi:hypothetical protein
VSAMITVMLGAHQVAHKLPVSRFSGKRDFSHLEFQRVTGYVRRETVERHHGSAPWFGTMVRQ